MTSPGKGRRYPKHPKGDLGLSETQTAQPEAK